jgi:quercetin dioxygenase-like cupin family protein
LSPKQVVTSLFLGRRKRLRGAQSCHRTSLSAYSIASKAMYQAGRKKTMSTDETKQAEKFQGGKAVDLVAYQPSAVVSREILKKKTGSVTAFAFDMNQGLSEHTAPFDALVQVLEGSAEISIAGTPHRVGPGELLLMPANLPHALRAVERFKMLLVMIRDPSS